MVKDGRGRPQSTNLKTGPNYRMANWLNDNIDTLSGGKTNEELAEELGYERPNIISMWRTGRTRVPLDRVPKLADALGVSLPLLLTLWMDQYVTDKDYAKLTKLLARTVTDDEAALLEILRDQTKGRSFDIKKTEAKRLLPQMVNVHK